MDRTVVRGGCAKIGGAHCPRARQNFFKAMLMADASGKAALARTRSKTCRFFGDGSAREASWSAECQFRFGPETGLTAIEEFCPTPRVRVKIQFSMAMFRLLVLILILIWRLRAGLKKERSNYG